MTFYKKRERFENFSIKIGNFFNKFGLSPNQWTIMTLIPTFIAFYFLLNANFFLAALFFIIASFIDIIDGSVARVTESVTELGAYLDTIMDRYVEGIIIFGLLFISLPQIFMPSYIWIFLYFFGGIMTTYAKAAAKEKNLVETEIRGGLLERAERLIILFIGILLAHFNPIWLSITIIILAFLTNVTAVQRIYIAIRTSKK